MKPRSFFRWWLLGVSLAFPVVLPAQVPALIGCQGRVSIGGTNYDGTGVFQFALVNGTGSAFWSNGASAVSLTVNKGLYSVLLGDTNVANMAALSAAVFTNGDVRLRVSFAPQGQTPQWLSPDQRIASVGYAFSAEGLDDGIWRARSGNVVDGEGQTHSNLLVFSSAGDWRMAFLPNGEIHARGDLSTEGNIYADGEIQAEGAFETAGDISINGGGNQQVHLGADGTVNAMGDLQVGGTGDFTGDLDVQGEANLHSNLMVDGQANIASNLNADGNARIGGTLEVEGDVMADHVSGIQNLAVQTLTVTGQPVPTVETPCRIVYGSVLNGGPLAPSFGFSVQTNAVAGIGTAYWGDAWLQGDKQTITCGDSSDHPAVFSTPRYVFYGGKIRRAQNCVNVGGATTIWLAKQASDLELGFQGSMDLNPPLSTIYAVTFDTPFSDIPTVIVTSGDDNDPNVARNLHEYFKLEGPGITVGPSGFSVVHGIEGMGDDYLNEPAHPQSDIFWQFIAIGRR